MDTVSQPTPDAAAKAERQTDIHFDFELEDIIAGNTPASDVGKQILAIVEDGQNLPTQGKVEAALMPLYEATAADFFSREGGTGEPPPANRQSVKEHAVKVIQARKVKRVATARAARGPRKQMSFPITGFQLGAIAVLIGLIVLVIYLRS
jgi:hypothetical protein